VAGWKACQAVWYSQSAFFHRGLDERAMKPNQNNDPLAEIFKTGTSVSDSPSWFDSLLHQIRELRDEKKHPRPQVKVTAQRDPRALDKLVEMPSPVLSLYSVLHPRKIETSVEPVEVEEIWSKPKTGLPRLLSLGVHVLIVGLALVPWVSGLPKKRQVNETAVVVYTPQNLVLPLTPNEDKSGGGGGGGRKTLTPPSLGKLPKAADKQIVPPDPEPPKNPDPKLIVEPTVVAPQLATLPQINLLNLGDPNGVVGPPSAGPGVGGGIGTGQGRGVGEGKGPGVGPGEGGGNGGGPFRVGGGVSPPTIVSRVEPQYSEEARKARYQGTVVLEAIVKKDGTVDILRVVRSLGFGLDENAIQALKQWRFRPGMRNGIPVDVALNIEVNFNLR
jgi:protein TonB